MPVDVRLWNRLYCVAFDDVTREMCATDRIADPASCSDARALAEQFLQRLVLAASARRDSFQAHEFARLMRGTLFIRFGERVLYWLDHLPEVEAEYARRVRLLCGMALTADELRPYVDRGD